MTLPFVRKLRHGARLSPDDERLLGGLALQQHRLGAREDIFLEGDSPSSLTLILDGWACRFKQLESGRRQIIAIFLPGDLCEPFGILPRRVDHSVGTITPVTLARPTPKAMRALADESPRIDTALWWDLLSAVAAQHERVVSLGRRSAVERLGHLLCELHLRLRAVGLADGDGFDLPLTQADLGDALGLSSVHVNRSLQDLRAAGLITLRGRRLTLHDIAGLQALSFFDPAFLHLDHASD